jgi:hypothetical protein
VIWIKISSPPHSIPRQACGRCSTRSSAGLKIEACVKRVWTVREVLMMNTAKLALRRASQHLSVFR